ncbi:RlmE family RNA methyltransferase [Rhodopseudomonas palustris]|uniref:Ribosomal RNA large subunit methyltransferase E n=1 Tax=Thiospirillum jenense TaxID=1653858 RepID=A0A839H3A5_9GAMM|nr:RlmE family RNA methyltransferase [Rhodopseudomonas palustris]MBB1124853.1 RlmE family RNA methyltransferase [Thiospirillum jenense]
MKSKSSQQWLARQQRDPYVQQAQRDGYRSRAAYKLLEINQKERLLRPGMRVLDLGAAPGGWSQVAAQAIGRSGTVIAVDLLPITPLPGVTVLQGDFTDAALLAQLHTQLAGQAVDVVLSDLAPTFSGVVAVDQPRSIYLGELAAELAVTVLKPNGGLVLKAFHGTGLDDLLRTLRQQFVRVTTRKPPASRAQSKEIYLVARQLRPLPA